MSTEKSRPVDNDAELTDKEKYWQEDEPIIRMALIDIGYSVTDPLPMPSMLRTGVLGKSRVWPLTIRTSGGAECSLIAKRDESKRSHKEWEAIQGLRKLVTPIQAMRPLRDNKPEHGVVIYENVAEQALSGYVWTLEEFLNKQLANNLENSLLALKKVMRPLSLFYTSEPGAARLADDKGQSTWESAFPDWSKKLAQAKKNAPREWRDFVDPTIPDPFEYADKFMSELHGRTLRSRIHGDMNLTNALVALNGQYAPEQVFLIDLANSQPDALTLLDLTRLECEFWHEIFAASPAEDRQGVSEMEWPSIFVTVRDYIDGRTTGLPDTLSPFALNAATWINTIRKEAFRILGSYQQEYGMADYMTGLYLTHILSLGFPSVCESDIKRHIAMLGAALALEYVLNLERGRNPDLPVRPEILIFHIDSCDNQIKPDPTPINRQELERMFREVYRLDRLDFGHLGTTPQKLEQKLDLQRVYVALNVKDRSFDRVIQAAQVEALTVQQQKNLPLLLQRFDEVLFLEHEKNQRAFETGKETDDKQLNSIARKILDECNARNIREAEVIISEIITGQRIKRDLVCHILWTLSNWAIVPRPLAEIPAKDTCYLIIGDAGGGKSTACRYMALRCFEDDKVEFGITGETPLPIYLRLEDFGTLIDDSTDDVCCLLECAEKFWQHEGKTEVFTAGQLYYALQHQPVWLFLDGLDEISNPDIRRRLTAVVHELVESEEFPQLRLMLTSRPAAVTDELLTELGMPYYRLLPLEQKQIEDFAHNYYTANLTEETTDQVTMRAKELIDALDDVPAAKQLATNPLLLTVTAVLHYKEGKLPRYRAELYEKCIDQLMAQRAATQGKLETGRITFTYPAAPSKPIIDWNHNQIIDMLRDLAFSAHQRIGDEVFLNRELMFLRLQQSDHIPPEKRTSSELEKAAESFLDECDRLIGLLAFRGGHYVFIHRTFQEYLAAHWLSLQREADQQKHLFDMLKNPAHWREVIRLFFNRLGKSNPNFGDDLIEQLGAQATELRDIQLIPLAAESLNDFEDYQQRYRSHGTIKNNLQNLRDTAHDQPKLFLACGDALGLMNEPEIDVFDPPMVLCEPTQPFIMGSDEETDERPIHPVQLSPFSIGIYPVTNKEFSEFIKCNGYGDEQYWYDEVSSFRFDGREFFGGLKERIPRLWLDEQFGRDHLSAPVVGVSWYEAMAYCRWWSLTFGYKHQPQCILSLPTEAEWEYACRAGTTTPFNTGENLTTDQANYNGNYPYKDNSKGNYLQRTTPVGSYPPNNWGLYDMHGNVWEWCNDWYGDYPGESETNPTGAQTGSTRVIRGGSWSDNADGCRSAIRYNINPDGRSSNLGFRVVSR